jgi:hypothetical protein
MNPRLAHSVPVRDPQAPCAAAPRPLSSRDRSLLAMLVQKVRVCGERKRQDNPTDREIAAALHVTQGSVRQGISRLVRRLRVENQQDLTRLLLEIGPDGLERRLLDEDARGYDAQCALPKVKAPEFDAFWMFGESAEAL